MSATPTPEGDFEKSPGASFIGSGPEGLGGGPATPIAGYAAGRTVGAGASLATVAQVTSAAATGLAGVVVARSLGPSGTGSFNVVLTALLLLLMPSSLGIGLGVAYHVAGRRWPPAEALAQSQAAAFAFGLIGAGVGLALGVAGSGTAFEDIPLATVALGLAALPFYISWDCGAQLALALNRFEAQASILGGQSVLGLLLIAALAPPFELTGAVAGLTASHALTSAAVLVWGRRALPRAERGWLRRARARIRAAVGFGVRPALNNALLQLNYRADLLLLNAVAASAITGQYAIALTVTSFTMLLPGALALVILPRVSALAVTGDPGEREIVIVKAIRHAVLIVLASTAILAPGLLLVPLIYGDRFEPTIEMGWILTPGVAALGLQLVLAAIVAGMGQPRYSLYAALLITPPTLALYGVMVPLLEGTGAALASTISYSAGALLWYAFFRRVTGIRALTRFVPRRSELDDYRLLARRMRARFGRRRSES